MPSAAASEKTQRSATPTQVEKSTESGGATSGSAGAAQAWKGYVRSVQAKGGANALKGAGAEARAAEGVKGGGGPLPHGEVIQRAFGRHDVGGVSAHTGGDASKAARSLGAEAFATGQDVAFAGAPDLHTAAHEAAHVVQQRGGVQLKGGVGQSGDEHERHADAVADKVVRGQSAEKLLDQVAKGGASAKGVQLKEKKAVSGKASGRLDRARKAIAHTKSILNFGAGNQAEALQANNFNSYYRLLAMRTPQCWELAPEVRPIAAQYPEALTAAKADLAHGGNCGEHAQIAFDYLRVTAVGETINMSDVEGLDHAFVLLGDVGGEADNALVVSDPWPTAATATLWEDHFAFTPDRAKINLRHTATADGQAAKEVIARGLKLSAYGKQMIAMKDTDQQRDDKLGRTRELHIWRHSGAAASGKDYDYQGPDAQQGRRSQTP